VAGPNPAAFRAAFGVGADDGAIHPVDGLGVALAAIQGLHELILRQRAELTDLRRRLEASGRPAP
jgi:hypothetical protein